MKRTRKAGIAPFISVNHTMIPRDASIVPECWMNRLRAPYVQTTFQWLAILNKTSLTHVNSIDNEKDN